MVFMPLSPLGHSAFWDPVPVTAFALQDFSFPPKYTTKRSKQKHFPTTVGKRGQKDAKAHPSQLRRENVPSGEDGDLAPLAQGTRQQAGRSALGGL